MSNQTIILYMTVCFLMGITTGVMVARGMDAVQKRRDAARNQPPMLTRSAEVDGMYEYSEGRPDAYLCVSCEGRGRTIHSIAHHEACPRALYPALTQAELDDQARLRTAYQRYRQTGVPPWEERRTSSG